MENAKDEDTGASFSWWQDSHNRPPQSPWLQATLSDLDDKTKLMMSIIDEDGGDSFARRAELYYRRRPELLDTIKDLHKSYGSLAQRYMQLPSVEPIVAMKQVQYFQNSRLEFPRKKQELQAVKTVEGGTWINDVELRVLKLTEDNLYRQAELMRSNNEKREAIRHFCSRVNRLVDEHRD